MTNQLLEELTSDDFLMEVGALVPPPMLRLVLQRTGLVQRVAEEMRRGTITEENVRAFVSAQLGELRRGVPLEHDLAVAAIAVALEAAASRFAADFLAELAGLSIAEMQQSIFMARECLRHRSPPPPIFEKSFVIADEVPRADQPLVGVVVDDGSRRLSPGTFTADVSIGNLNGVP